MSEAEPKKPRNLAIIGGGSSGLISLKYARDHLPEWEIVCFEKSNCATGCWGRPYAGFVSTSTKYTTQFACYPQFDDCALGDGHARFDDFFCEDEYGQYLESFADACVDRNSIRLNTIVEHVRRIEASGDWQLEFRSTDDENGELQIEDFHAVIICTGLTARPRTIADESRPSYRMSPDGSASASDQQHLEKHTAILRDLSILDKIKGQAVVVVGGGESAVDFADRLAAKDRNNRVFLSLRSGMRLSPRYHPIRGVPSDFLRNRLMLSIHPDLRNRIGEVFVAARIRFQAVFQHWFPHQHSQPVDCEAEEHRLRKREWAMRLRATAKDDLFNMFHNKSDRFLDAVADGRITIVGPPTDRAGQYREFASEETRQIDPDVIVPAIGYQSQLGEISNGAIQLKDFFLGCCHRNFPNLFLVGFARPIIGNVPTISEMQALLVTKLISRQCSLPFDFAAQHEHDIEVHQNRYSKLNMTAIYPVEMIPYCDRIARILDNYPSIKRCGSFSAWCRIQMAASSTMHYHLQSRQASNLVRSATIHMPVLFIVLLLALQPVDWTYRFFQRLRRAD